MKNPQYIAYNEDVTEQKKVGFYFFLVEPKPSRHFIPLVHLRAGSSARRAARVPRRGWHREVCSCWARAKGKQSRTTRSSSGGFSHPISGWSSQDQPPLHPNKEALGVWPRFPATPFSPDPNARPWHRARLRPCLRVVRALQDYCSPLRTCTGISSVGLIDLNYLQFQAVSVLFPQGSSVVSCCCLCPRDAWEEDLGGLGSCL